MKVFSFEGIMIIAVIAVMLIALLQFDRFKEGEAYYPKDMNGIGLCLIALSVLCFIAIFR